MTEQKEKQEIVNIRLLRHAPSPDGMTKLFKDDLGNWYYQDTTKEYFRFDDKGVKNAKILGKFLPDPDLVLSSRIDAYNKINKDKITIGHPTALKMKCRPETYQLWKHWLEVK